MKGKVVDEKKEPLPGVTILVKGTSVGAVTDANGQFAMRVPETANLALVFSFIGMEPKEVAYKGQQEFYVVMKDCQGGVGRGGCNRIHETEKRELYR